MRARSLPLPMLTLLLGACASPSPVPSAPVVVEPMPLPAVPEAVMVPRESNFRQRLLRILPPLQTTPTK